MSDPRGPEIIKAAQTLALGSTIIYRHFGNPDARQTAQRLRQVCARRGLQFLIGQDAQLAITCRAHGVHFAQRDMHKAGMWRARRPDWILTAAAHDSLSVAKAQNLPLDALTLSPVFKSESPSAGPPLGVRRFKRIAAQSRLPLFALGGINQQTCGMLIGSGAAGIAGVSGL